MNTTVIDTQCGIYDTETTIRDYGHKVCVTSPCIRWENNTGTLDFEKRTFTDARSMAAMRTFAAADCLATDDGDMIGDYISC